MIWNRGLSRIEAMCCLLLLFGCRSHVTTNDSEKASASPVEVAGAGPELQALNAFYYYRDVDKAWEFYRDVLGFETVVDYGFAKILRVAESSYLTLVDAERGMHTADEPKSVTLALVTQQVEGWYQYLTTAGVTIHSELRNVEGRPHDGFVAVDPEGYFLEFERFNPHPENKDLMPLLSDLETTLTEIGDRPKELGIQATVFWLYYHDLGPIERFYESLLGVRLLVDQGWAKVYSVAGSGFIGLVDGARGLHQATEQKGVTLSFFTADVETWFDRASGQDGLELRTPEITSESDRVRTFSGYDPEGYFLEWDTFLPVKDNEVLLQQLEAK